MNNTKKTFIRIILLFLLILICFLIKYAFTKNPCDKITCPTGKKCVGGKCVQNDPCDKITCPTGQKCVGGKCVQNDPCDKITCPTGQKCVGGKCIEYGVPLIDQKDLATPNHWSYKWGTPPYGGKGDITGVLQIVNGGSEIMWIRYSGTIISDPNNILGWVNFITTPSSLNGYIGHKWNKLGDNNMTGQGDGFQLLPGEYQIVPFTGSACWFGGTLGCCEYGNDCVISPGGRGGGLNANDQPNTLFEWTAPGVWDASLVDGYSLPMRIEVDGCSNPTDCDGSDPIVNLSLSDTLCPNKIINNDNIYVGCKSMCGCQNNAIKNGVDTDPECTNMTSTSIVGQPFPPGGYCGCPEQECVDWLRNLYSKDQAGMVYCNAVTQMTKNSKGERAVYCQAYDDKAGTKSYGNGVIKVIIYNNGFESVKDRSSTCSQPTPPTSLPKCSDINIKNDQCGTNKYICTNNSTEPSKWGCSSKQFTNCVGKQCIKY